MDALDLLIQLPHAVPPRPPSLSYTYFFKPNESSSLCFKGLCRRRSGVRRHLRKTCFVETKWISLVNGSVKRSFVAAREEGEQGEQTHVSLRPVPWTPREARTPLRVAWARPPHAGPRARNRSGQAILRGGRPVHRGTFRSPLECVGWMPVHVRGTCDSQNCPRALPDAPAGQNRPPLRATGKSVFSRAVSWPHRMPGHSAGCPQVCAERAPALGPRSFCSKTSIVQTVCPLTIRVIGAGENRHACILHVSNIPLNNMQHPLLFIPIFYVNLHLIKE